MEHTGRLFLCPGKSRRNGGLYGIFRIRYRVNDNDAVACGKKDVYQFPLGGKALAGARGAEVHNYSPCYILLFTFAFEYVYAVLLVSQNKSYFSALQLNTC